MDFQAHFEADRRRKEKRERKEAERVDFINQLKEDAAKSQTPAAPQRSPTPGVSGRCHACEAIISFTAEVCLQ